MMNPNKNVMGYLEHHRHLKYAHCLITIVHYQSNSATGLKLGMVQCGLRVQVGRSDSVMM